MDRHLLALLYGEVKIMRADVAQINPFDANKPGRLGSGISRFIDVYNDLLERVKAAVAEDTTAEQSLRALTPANRVEERNVSGHVEGKSHLTAGLGRILAVIESLMTPTAAAPMRATREGVFFTGDYFEPLLLLTDFIKQAKRSIVIVDGYIGDGSVILGALAGKVHGVQVQILTKQTEGALVTLARGFLKQYGDLTIKTSGAFHDRFLILDDSDFYHFGASLKDMGARGFMFSRIEEQEVIDRIREKLTSEWSKAAPVKL